MYVYMYLHIIIIYIYICVCACTPETFYYIINYNDISINYSISLLNGVYASTYNFTTCGTTLKFEAKHKELTRNHGDSMCKITVFTNCNATCGNFASKWYPLVN